MEFSYLVHYIGPVLRTIRKEKNIILNDLARKTGISTAMLSKIENGRLIPTLPRLLDIFGALAIDPKDFFEKVQDEVPFSGYLHIREKDYKPYVKEETAEGFQYYSILDKPIGNQPFQISLVTLQPNNVRPKVTTDAFEFLYILEGEIEYHISKDIVLLKKGESFFFDGNLPHVPLNKTSEVVSYIVIYFFNHA